jgi:hypothetical protein
VIVPAVRLTWSLSCLALLALASCHPGVGDLHFDITYDPCEVIVIAPAADTSDAEMTSIDDALAMWNDTGATRLTRQGRPGDQRVPMRFESAAPAFYGVYQDEIGDVVINRELRNRHARAITIAHELGHALGLHHTGASAHASVMQAGNLDTPPTADDVRALEAIWGQCPVATDGLTAGW